MAQATGGQITWNLDVDDSKFKKGMASARSEANNTANHVSKSGEAFDKLGSVATQAAKAAAVALGAAATATVAFGLKSAASFEQTRIGLENMLGSADAARDMLSKVSKFAAETPFEFPELAQATRQLVAFGFSGKDAFSTMKQLGDVSAAIGAPIGDLAYLMGTLRAQGRAFTIDIRQFAMRGIPIYEYLAKVFKTNTEEVTKLIEAGKVGFPEVQKAFQLMTAEGGKFHGTMEKQSKSLSGLFSTLKDNIGLTARELIGITQEGDIKPGSLFDNVRRGVNWLNSNLPQLVQNLQKSGRNIASEVLPTLKQWGKNIYNVADSIAGYLGPKIEALVNSLRRLAPAIQRITSNLLAPLAGMLGQVVVFAIGKLLDSINLLTTILRPFMNLLSNMAPVLAFLAGAFVTLRTAMFIWDVIDKIRIGFMTLQLVTIPGLVASLAGLAAFFTTPWGIAVGLAATAVGFLAMKMIDNKNKANDLSIALDNLKRVKENLKRATDELRNAELGLEGAQLRVEQAAIQEKEAISQYGAGSLQARIASHQLKQAQEDLKRAQDQVTEATKKAKAAEDELAKNSSLIKSTEAKIGQLQALANVLNRPVSVGPITAKPGFGPTAQPAQDALNILNGTRAFGGPVSAGKSYLVGEEGPELFTPRGSGEITPNDQLTQESSSFVYNIGTITISSDVDGESWLQKLTRNQEIVDRGLVPSKGVI